MKILLSPAKSIDTSRKIIVPETSIAPFEKETVQLAGKLQKMSVKKLMGLYHVSQEIAELNHERFKLFHWPTEVTSEVVPAVCAFTGEVYRGLNVEEFDSTDFQVAQKQIRILSGLYGMLKPLDLMYPYRLEMGTKWAITPKTPNLYTFWKKKVTDLLQSELEKDEPIVNLASSEYSKVLDFKRIKNPVVTPIFKDFKNGDYKIIMMYAKHARGEMANFIVRKKLTNIDELKLFNGGGYQFDANQSTDTEWVFTR